jgi:hypothetical protein
MPSNGVRRTAQPRHPVRIDPSNRFGRAVRIFLYPLNDRYVYDAVTGQTYRIGTTGIPTSWGNAVRGGVAPNIRTAACIPDLLMSKPVTLVMLLQGRATSWVANKGLRLFDVSSGSGLQLHAVYQSSTQVNVQALTFGDTGAPNTLVTCDPLAACAIGVTYVPNAARLFYAPIGQQGKLIGTDTVTADADAAGTDTRVDVFGSTGTNVDYSGGFWLSGALSDSDMAEFMRNPWQALLPHDDIMSSASASSNVTLDAALGTLTLTGLVPAITQGNIIAAPLGTVTLTGLVPSITQGNSLTAVLGTLTLTGLVPTFAQGQSLLPPLGTLTLTGLAPTMGSSQSMLADFGVMTLTGLAPSFEQSGGSGVQPRGNDWEQWLFRRIDREEIADDVAGKRHAKPLPAQQEAIYEVARELQDGEYDDEQEAVDELRRIAKLRAWKWREEQFTRLLQAYHAALEQARQAYEDQLRQQQLLVQGQLDALTTDLRRKRAAAILLLAASA